MMRGSLRILVVEDDYLLASKLARDIIAAGDVVVGPFTDVHEAISRVGLVQAAILGVNVGGEATFDVADSLLRNEVPFVFLTRCDTKVIPKRFQRQRIYAKPNRVGQILHDLHTQHRNSGPPEDDSLEAVLLDMIRRSCVMMPDRASADRLVETVLLRAIAEAKDCRFKDDMRPRLMDMLDEEYRQHGRRFLN